jgi:hypothetical protein
MPLAVCVNGYTLYESYVKIEVLSVVQADDQRETVFEILIAFK